MTDVGVLSIRALRCKLAGHKAEKEESFEKGVSQLPSTLRTFLGMFSKHVRSFFDVPQWPDQNTYHLVTSHWIWEQIQGKCGDIGQRSDNWC